MKEKNTVKIQTQTKKQKGSYEKQNKSLPIKSFNISHHYHIFKLTRASTYLMFCLVLPAREGQQIGELV